MPDPSICALQMWFVFSFTLLKTQHGIHHSHFTEQGTKAERGSLRSQYLNYDLWVPKLSMDFTLP